MQVIRIVSRRVALAVLGVSLAASASAAEPCTAK